MSATRIREDHHAVECFSSFVFAATLAFSFQVAFGQQLEQRPGALKPAPQNSRKPEPIDPAKYDQLRLGDVQDGKIVVPTNQVLSPAGRQVGFSGRPTDVALSPNGKWLGVLDRNHVAIIDPTSAKILSREAHASGSYAGILFTPDGKRLLAANIRGNIGVFSVDDSGKLSADKPIALPTKTESPSENPANSATGPQSPNKQPLPAGAEKTAVPIGLAFGAGGKSLWAVLNMRNSVAEIELASGRLVRELPVGNAPYGIVLVKNRAYVSNWAGRHPDQGDTKAESGAGSPVRVDASRFIANDGSVSVWI